MRVYEGMEVCVYIQKFHIEEKRKKGGCNNCFNQQ